MCRLQKLLFFFSSPQIDITLNENWSESTTTGLSATKNLNLFFLQNKVRLSIYIKIFIIRILFLSLQLVLLKVPSLRWTHLTLPADVSFEETSTGWSTGDQRTHKEKRIFTTLPSATSLSLTSFNCYVVSIIWPNRWQHFYPAIVPQWYSLELHWQSPIQKDIKKHERVKLDF